MSCSPSPSVLYPIGEVGHFATIPNNYPPPPPYPGSPPPYTCSRFQPMQLTISANPSALFVRSLHPRPKHTRHLSAPAQWPQHIMDNGLQCPGAPKLHILDLSEDDTMVPSSTYIKQQARDYESSPCRVRSVQGYACPSNLVSTCVAAIDCALNSCRLIMKVSTICDLEQAVIISLCSQTSPGMERNLTTSVEKLEALRSYLSLSPTSAPVNLAKLTQ